MKSDELKKILKPLIKRCITETLFESASLKPLIKECIGEMVLEGNLLSNIVSETIKGMKEELLVESAPSQPKQPKQQRPSILNSKGMGGLFGQKSEAAENEKKLRNMNIGGVNIFEGVQASPVGKADAGVKIPGAKGQAKTAISNIHPDDPGVDISFLFGNNE